MSPDFQTLLRCCESHTHCWISFTHWFSPRFTDAFLQEISVSFVSIRSSSHPSSRPQEVVPPAWARHWHLILQETGSDLTCLREAIISSAFSFSFPFKLQLWTGRKPALEFYRLDRRAFIYMWMCVCDFCLPQECLLSHWYQCVCRWRNTHVQTWICDIWITADVDTDVHHSDALVFMDVFTHSLMVWSEL